MPIATSESPAALKVLALDCATVTGWATNAAGGWESGVQSFPLRRGASTGMRFLEFRQWLTGLIERVRPEVVVYEQAHHRGGAPTELCVGFVTRVQEAAAAAGAEYRSCHSATLKAWATGNGRADKAAMIQAARDRLGREPVDDNEADAVLLLAWAEAGFPESARRKSSRKKKAAAEGGLF